MLRGLIYGFLLCAIAAVAAALVFPLPPEPAAQAPVSEAAPAGAAEAMSAPAATTPAAPDADAPQTMGDDGAAPATE